jgi:hypothetical protein
MTLANIVKALSEGTDLRIKGMNIVLKSMEVTEEGHMIFGTKDVRSSIKAKDGMPILDRDGNFKYDTKTEPYKIKFYDVKQYLDSIEVASKAPSKPKEDKPKKAEKPKTVSDNEGEL